MRHGKTCPHQELDDEVAIADTPQAVLGDVLEPELLCEELAVDNEWVAGECATSERQSGHAGRKLAKAFQICVEGERVREKEVGPTDRLTALQCELRNGYVVWKRMLTWRWV